MIPKIICPSCSRSVGGSATEGGMRIRMSIVLFDLDTGSVHGPCPYCKQDIVITHRSVINKELFDKHSSTSRAVVSYIT